MDLPESLRERAGKAAQRWAPGAQVTNVMPLAGGASSLTFVAELLGAPQPHSRVVLKVAPPGLPPVRNRDVLRQGRLMAALYGRPGVPVPPFLFQDAGAAPYGAADDGADGDSAGAGAPPFIAMGLIPGECVEPVLAESRDPARFDEIRVRALDAARALAALHSVEPRRQGSGMSLSSRSRTRSTGGPARSLRCRPTCRASTSGARGRCTRPSLLACRRSSTTAITGSATRCAPAAR
jgi:aminoglycoside phosphotransferase (APT) family kinase protein